MARQEFRLLFCQRFRCPPSEYEDRAFRMCLYWHARLLAPVVGKLMPNLFAQDLKFIRYLGDSTGVREVGADLMNFRDVDRCHPSFWRTSLKIRVSGRKAGRLAQQLFAAEREANLPTNGPTGIAVGT